MCFLIVMYSSLYESIDFAGSCPLCVEILSDTLKGASLHLLKTITGLVYAVWLFTHNLCLTLKYFSSM